MEKALEFCKQSVTNTNEWNEVFETLVGQPFECAPEAASLILQHLVPLVSNYEEVDWDPSCLNNCFKFFRELQIRRHGLDPMYTIDFHIAVFNISFGNQVPECFQTAAKCIINMLVLNHTFVSRQLADSGSWKIACERFREYDPSDFLIMFRVLFYTSMEEQCRDDVFDAFFNSEENLGQHLFNAIATCMSIDQVKENSSLLEAAKWAMKTLLNFTVVKSDFLVGDLPGFRECFAAGLGILYCPLQVAPDFDDNKIYFGSGANAKCTLLDLKKDICNLMAYTSLLPKNSLEVADEHAEALYQLLEIVVLQYDKAPDQFAGPILGALQQFVQASEDVQVLFKTKLFKEMADRDNDDPSRDMMHPLLDEETTVRNILIEWLMSISEGVKLKTGDLFWAIADLDKNEFCRLVGIGPSAGYLNDMNLLPEILS